MSGWVAGDIERVVVIFDGIFSMRGDYAPIDKIQEISREYSGKFSDGVITVVDDSHGIGAYGKRAGYAGILRRRPISSSAPLARHSG